MVRVGVGGARGVLAEGWGEGGEGVVMKAILFSAKDRVPKVCLGEVVWLVGAEKLTGLSRRPSVSA